MAKKVAITEEQRERAKQLGFEARRLRFVVTCPYTAGTELAAIWEAARWPNRRAMPEVEVPVQNAVDLLNLHFKGQK